MRFVIAFVAIVLALAPPSRAAQPVLAFTPDQISSCPKEPALHIVCKEATYKTTAGSSKAVYWRECKGTRSGDDFRSTCATHLHTTAGRLELPKPIDDVSLRIDKAMASALGTRPAGFGNSNLAVSQFPHFYDVIVDHATDVCVRLELKFPFAGQGNYCTSGYFHDSVRLIAPMSLRDAIAAARAELKKSGLAQTDPKGAGLLGWNLRLAERGRVEYVMILYDRLPQGAASQPRPTVQYNFVIDAATGQMKFTEAPFDTPMPSSAP